MSQDVCHPTQSRTGCWTSEQGTRRWTLEIGHDTPDTRDRTQDTSHRPVDTRHMTQDTGLWMLEARGDTRHRTQDTKYGAENTEPRNSKRDAEQRPPTHDPGHRPLDARWHHICQLLLCVCWPAAGGTGHRCPDRGRHTQHKKCKISILRSKHVRQRI